MTNEAKNTRLGFLIFLLVSLVFWGLVFFWLSGCSIIKYEAHNDGSTLVSGYELGTNNALSGAKFSTDGHGARSLTIESLNTDQVQGLKQINQGLSLIIQGAIQGAK